MCFGASQGYFAAAHHGYWVTLHNSARVVMDRHSILAIAQLSYPIKASGPRGKGDGAGRIAVRATVLIEGP